MEKIPKVSYVLRDSCFKTCRSFPQKKPYEGIYQEEFLNKTEEFLERLQQLLINKRIFDEVPVGSRFVLFEVIILISLGIVKDLSSCFW